MFICVSTVGVSCGVLAPVQGWNIVALYEQQRTKSTTIKITCKTNMAALLMQTADNSANLEISFPRRDGNDKKTILGLKIYLANQLQIS